LPDQEVILALEAALGHRAGVGLLRTDATDKKPDEVEEDPNACERVEKVGRDEDGRAGGCDAWVLEVK
jgi:hypothetical protein